MYVLILTTKQWQSMILPPAHQSPSGCDVECRKEVRLRVSRVFWMPLPLRKCASVPSLPVLAPRVINPAHTSPSSHPLAVAAPRLPRLAAPCHGGRRRETSLAGLRRLLLDNHGILISARRGLLVTVIHGRHAGPRDGGAELCHNQGRQRAELGVCAVCAWRGTLRGHAGLRGSGGHAGDKARRSQTQPVSMWSLWCHPWEPQIVESCARVSSMQLLRWNHFSSMKTK